MTGKREQRIEKKLRRKWGSGEVGRKTGEQHGGRRERVKREIWREG